MSPGAVAEHIEIYLLGVPRRVVVVAVVKLGAPVVGPTEIDLLLAPDFVVRLVGFGLLFSFDGTPVVGSAGINLLFTPDFVVRLVGVGFLFASDGAVILKEVAILFCSCCGL